MATEVDPSLVPGTRSVVPDPIPIDAGVPLPPDSTGYRLKRKLLGPPLHSDELEHQRLGKPTALAVFASDNLSSSAYATEEILHSLVPAVGLLAFSLVMPITVALLVMLGLLILSYRETIKAYPSAGGAYLVTRDNFGIIPAQVAGASLLVGYILTVAVSVSAGTAALISSFDALSPYRIPISVGFIVIVMYGNLRGVKESGKVFAVPTYFFMLNMALLLGYGLVKYLGGDLDPLGGYEEGVVHINEVSKDAGLYMGATAVVLMKAFASGGSAVTGVEAISNGVPAFQEPAWRNARQTLVLMGAGLGVMFLGLSALSTRIKVLPFEDGTPTVLSQVGDAVYGAGALGEVLTYSLQAATMLILVLAANTGFADFPRLASFQASDSFLPRQLTKRGHRLVFSNGILALAGTAAVLVVATNAEVTRLIPLYAIGVFIGFTLSQAGMTRHHLTHKGPGWRRSLVINGVGAFISAGVVLIVTYTKFSNGAWVMVVAMPLIVLVLLRLNRQYRTEAADLEHEVPAAATAPILRRHVVLVFVDRLDGAVARSIQYARTLTPDELRAVHFVLDEAKAEDLAEQWRRLGLQRVPLELVGCPDRRLTRAAVECVARELAGGETEVSVLLPDRKYKGIWHRILHDKTADAIQEQLSKLAHANVTTVPFHLGTRAEAVVDQGLAAVVPLDLAAPVPEPDPAGDEESAPPEAIPDRTRIIDARWRRRVTVVGRVRSLRVAPQHDAPTLELVLVDETGAISVVFLGRRGIAGVRVGSRLVVRGTVGIHKARLAVLNPSYTLLPGS
ncbi:MAG TPA: amino acid permease [Acidimicrobiales bacterium]|nr:amino acid permease [Acidimicrobiales bacterium]